MFKSNSITGLLTGALIALGLTVTSSAFADLAGNLEIQGNVRIAQSDSDVFLRLSNTRYAWFSGDRIDTGGGTAILDLERGVSIGFPRETRASLRLDSNVIHVNLETGALLYAIPESRMDLVVTTGTEVLSTRTDGDYLRVSASGPGSYGIVQRLDDGQLRVTVRDGMMDVRDQGGTTYYRVEANQRVTFAGEGPGMMIAQIEAIAPPSEPEPGVIAEPEPFPPPAEPATVGVNPLLIGGIAIAGLGLAAAGGGGGGGGGGGRPHPPDPPS